MAQEVPERKEQGSDRSQEIRLGLVMYGGVSLAIYIFGVAQEFFRAVRGRGVYRLLKDLTDSDLVVDVISGTSAGGVNGILLAYALCNEREFSDCNGLWRGVADLMRLIHEPHAPRDKVRSVLDSGHYLDQMKNAMAGMSRIEPTGEDPSPVRELDLFITGTDVDGAVYTWFDGLGHAVDIKDHRTMFLLKHRAERKKPFEPDDATHLALAKLARITSCFPVAFQPVRVGGEDGEADSKLREWGNLDAGRARYYLDGGVLDNKPFTYTIREIFYRMADRKVDRKLFYVEPDPERFAAGPQPPPTEPSAPGAALKSLVSIPGYESIAEDLKLLASRNEKLRRYNRLVASLGPAELGPPRGPETGEGPGGEAAAGSVYIKSRLVELSERVVRGVLRERGQDVRLTGSPRTAAENLFRAFDELLVSGGETLLHFDVYFRVRRLFDLMYRVVPPAPGGSEAARRTRRTLWLVGRQIKLLEILQGGMERLLDEAPFRWEARPPAELWREVECAFRILLAADGLLPNGYGEAWSTEDPGERWLDKPTLSEVNRELQRRSERIVARLTANEPLAGPEPFAGVFAATDACERRMLGVLAGGQTPDLAQVYDAYLRLDAQLFPLEVFGELREKDVIETVRISPFDAQRGFSNRSGGDKVSGDVLHHFGGFLKRSWRSNDILWGRLDGLCQLMETLLTPLRLREVAGSDLQGPLVALLSDPAYLETVLPAAPAAERAAIAGAFQRILTAPHPDYDESRPEGFARAFEERFQLSALLDRLVRAAQREILEEEVPRVIGDAVQQQAEWNQYRFTERDKAKALGEASIGLDPGTQTLVRTGPGNLDPLVIAAASERLAKEVAGEPGAAVALFENRSYRVGAESVEKDVPPLVLMEIAARALLSLRKAVIATASPETGNRLAASPVNRWLGFVLWAFYGFSGFMRRSRPGGKFLLLGVAVLSVLALVVGVKWWVPIVSEPGSGVSLTALALFIVLPSLALLGGAVWLAARARRPGS